MNPWDSSSDDDDDESDDFLRRRPAPTTTTKPASARRRGNRLRIEEDDDDGGDESSYSVDSDDTAELLRKMNLPLHHRQVRTKRVGGGSHAHPAPSRALEFAATKAAATAKNPSIESSSDDDDADVENEDPGNVGRQPPPAKPAGSAGDDLSDSDDTAELLRLMDLPPVPPAGATIKKKKKKKEGENSGSNRSRSPASNPDPLRGHRRRLRRSGSASSLSTTASSDAVLSAPGIFAPSSSAKTATKRSGKADVNETRGSSNINKENDNSRVDVEINLGDSDEDDDPGTPRRSALRAVPSPAHSNSSVDTAELMLHIQDPVAHPKPRSKRAIKKLQEEEQKQREREQQLEREQQIEREKQEQLQLHVQENEQCVDDFRLNDDDDDDSDASSSFGRSSGLAGSAGVMTKTPRSSHLDRHTTQREGGGTATAALPPDSRTWADPAGGANVTTPEASATTPQPASTIAYLQRPERTSTTTSRPSQHPIYWSGGEVPSSSNLQRSNHGAFGGSRRTSAAMSNPYHGSAERTLTSGSSSRPVPFPTPAADASRQFGTVPAVDGRSGAGLRTGHESMSKTPPQVLASASMRHEMPQPEPQTDRLDDEALLTAAFWQGADEEAPTAPQNPLEAANVVVREGLRAPPSADRGPYRPPLRRSPLVADDIRGFSDDEAEDKDARAFGFPPSPQPPRHAHEGLGAAEATMYGSTLTQQPVAFSWDAQVDVPPAPPSLHMPSFQTQPRQPNPTLDDYKNTTLGRRKRLRDAVAANPSNASGVVLGSASAAAAAAANRRPRPHPLHGLPGLPSVPWRAQHAAAPTTSVAAGLAAQSTFPPPASSQPAPGFRTALAVSSSSSSVSNDRAWSMAFAAHTANVPSTWNSAPASEPETGGAFGGHYDDQGHDNDGFEEDEGEEENYPATNRRGGGRAKGRGGFGGRGWGGRGGKASKGRPWRSGGGRGGWGGSRVAGGRGGRGGGNASNGRWSNPSTRGGGSGATASRDDPNLRHVGGADMSF